MNDSFLFRFILIGLLWNISMPAMVGWGNDFSPAEMESDVVIVMKDKAFHILKGGNPDPENPFFFMEAGVEHMITIRNEDTVAHEFVSPYFRNVEIMLSGEATMIFPKYSAGFRINPGNTITIRFEAPHLVDEMKTRQDLFWCNIHGKKPGNTMRGELILTETVPDIEKQMEKQSEKGGQR